MRKERAGVRYSSSDDLPYESSQVLGNPQSRRGSNDYDKLYTAFAYARHATMRESDAMLWAAVIAMLADEMRWMRQG